jgi:outer membrane protein OmpA-like peptidoglycan-associated protein
VKRIPFALLSLSALLLGSTARAEEGRFDAQVFRPSAAPRDLVMVPKTEVIGSMSPVIGMYYDVSLDPLALVNKDTGQTLHAVAARMNLTAMAGIGFFDWFDVTMAMPFVIWQSSDNLRSVGTEGPITTPALGDMRLSTKVALPYLNRKEEVKSGFGMALQGNINLPTGNQNAFASDGALSGGGGVIIDYRFGFGLLLATNLGVWVRPEHQFAGVKIGDMAQFGVAGEMYVVQRWGLSVIGEVYGYPSLTSFPDSPKQTPAEVLLGIRWQTKQGITITFGGSFGAACGFGAPAIRFFNSITWQPKNSAEQEEINRLMEREEDDNDHDGMIGKIDKCPDKPGLPANFGCPDVDTDEDGIMDREDECRELPAGPHGKRGCPLAYVKGDEIIILDQVHFATDKDIILDESIPVLEEVARVLSQHADIREVKIEGHTDVRASDAYNMNLSQRRVDSVKQALVQRGVDATRLIPIGFGHTQPLFDDKNCRGADEELTPECRAMTSKNRRVVFKITRFGAPPPKPIVGGSDAAVLPSGQTTLPSQGALPKGGTLPRGGTLPGQGVLQEGSAIESSPVLPNNSGTQNGGALPKGGVLPRK